MFTIHVVTALSWSKKTKFVLIEMSNHNLYINGCKYFEVDDLLRKNNFTLADIIVTYRKNGLV